MKFEIRVGFTVFDASSAALAFIRCFFTCERVFGTPEPTSARIDIDATDGAGLS